jgi:hypothetical protein
MKNGRWLTNSRVGYTPLMIGRLADIAKKDSRSNAGRLDLPYIREVCQIRAIQTEQAAGVEDTEVVR